MRKASFVFRLLGAALLAVALPALLAWSAEPAKKAPQVDPAVQDLVQGACKARRPAITPAARSPCRTP